MHEHEAAPPWLTPGQVVDGGTLDVDEAIGERHGQSTPEPFRSVRVHRGLVCRRCSARARRPCRRGAGHPPRCRTPAACALSDVRTSTASTTSDTSVRSTFSATTCVPSAPNGGCLASFIPQPAPHCPYSHRHPPRRP